MFIRELQGLSFGFNHFSHVINCHPQTILDWEQVQGSQWGCCIRKQQSLNLESFGREKPRECEGNGIPSAEVTRDKQRWLAEVGAGVKGNARRKSPGLYCNFLCTDSTDIKARAGLWGHYPVKFLKPLRTDMPLNAHIFAATRWINFHLI